MPAIAMEKVNRLVARYGYCSRYDRYGRCISSSSFYSWGRWVLVGVLIFAVLFVLLCCTCFARRRRRKGAQPVYGTGWMAPAGGKWGGQNNGTQMNNYGGYNQPAGGYNNQDWNQNQQYPQAGGAPYQSPPAYGQQPQYTGTTFNPNDGYYGNQQYPQQPGNTYQRDGAAYDAPPGPPPGK